MRIEKISMHERELRHEMECNQGRKPKMNQEQLRTSEMKAFCSLRLVLEGKAGRELPEIRKIRVLRKHFTQVALPYHL